MSNTLKVNLREGQKILFENPKRFTVMVAHRRWGKTYSCCLMLIIKALTSKKKRPQFGYLFPEAEQAEKVAWPQFKDFLAGMPGVNFNNLKKTITFDNNGAVIYVTGLKNPDSLRGLYFDHLIVDEYADAPASALGEVLYPTLTDRKGSLLITGTPKGQDGFYEICQIAKEMAAKDPENWAYVEQDVYNSGVFEPEEIEQFKDIMTEAQFQQEYLLNFEADFSNRYYSELVQKARDQGRIGDYGYDPKLKVYVAYDLGSDGTAMWFAQKKGNKVFLIDYEEYTDLKELSTIFNLLESKGYTYGKHILPHDATQTTIRGDASIVNQFRAQGHSCIVLKRSDKDAGIRAAQGQFIRCHFDMAKTNKGVTCLVNYQAKINKEGIVTKEPKHDRFSHGADAFRYLMLEIDNLDKHISFDPKTFKVDGDYNPFDF